MTKRVVLAVGLAFALLLALAPGASAHAALTSTEPASGAILESPPDAVVLTYTERVKVDEVKVLDAGMHRVDTGKAEKPNGHTVRMPLKSGLGNGGYVVAWRVVSADSHPVSGGFTFRVGASSTAVDPSVVQGLLAGQKAPRSLGVVLGLVRFVAFAGLLLLVGGTAFVAWLFPAGARDRNVRVVLWGALASLAVASALGIALQAASVAGKGLADALSPSILGDALDTTFGRVWLARIGLLVVAALLLRALDRASTIGWRVAGVATGVALIATPVLTGHADTGRWVGWAKAFDLAHVGGAAVWLGGLVVLLVAVLRPEIPDAREITERFSSLAFGCVVVVVLSGIFQAFRQVETFDGLDTTYGHLLVVKVVVVLVLIGVASLTRAALQGRLSFDDSFDEEEAEVVTASVGPGAAHIDEHREIGILRRLVGVEVAIAVLVLAVTALLVDASPLQAGQAAGGPYDQTHVVDSYLVNAVVVPGTVGPTDIHLYIDNPGGGLQPPKDVTATLSLASGGVSNIDVPLVTAGAKHWIANDVDVPIAGVWKLDVKVLVTEVDEVSTTFNVPIGGS